MAAFGTAEPDSNEGDCLVQLTEDRPLSTVSVALSAQLNKHQSSPTISDAPGRLQPLR
uniref:Uncharacterized protein n=1 Tax=Macrostomum lignano TaxID=282301 RepID=A0A1I8F3P4_9PLAT